MGELLLGGVGGGDLGDQDLGLGGNLDAGELGDLGGSHAGDAVIESAVLEHGGTQGLHLGTLLDEVAAALLELGLDLVIDGVDDGHGLLGSADHAVVEGLEWMMELTASSTSAVSSMTTGVLPAPTPSAGLPEE